MRSMNLAVGSLVLLGFLFSLFGVVFKLSGFNLLYPMITEVANFFVASSICFLMALVIDRFGD